MKFQWTWLIGILLAIIIAAFSVVNVEAVPVNYVFGVAEWPLVLVILGSALIGAAISGFVAMFRSVIGNRQIKELMKDVNTKELLIAAQQNEIAALQNEYVKSEKALLHKGKNNQQGEVTEDLPN